MVAGGRYLASDDAIRTFAADNAQTLTVEATWRSGRKSVVENAKPNQLIELSEADAITSPTPNSQLLFSLTSPLP